MQKALDEPGAPYDGVETHASGAVQALEHPSTGLHVVIAVLMRQHSRDTDVPGERDQRSGAGQMGMDDVRTERRDAPPESKRGPGQGERSVDRKRMPRAVEHPSEFGIDHGTRIEDCGLGAMLCGPSNEPLHHALGTADAAASRDDVEYSHENSINTGYLANVEPWSHRSIRI
ncbi:MAG: hypothetical protein M3417_14100 [Actinomycetota bacterium]|nr:hypothetical protein [Actinomycetota bacterium]